MRVARFAVEGVETVGYLTDHELVEVALPWRAVLEAVTGASRNPGLPETGSHWPLETGRLLAPLDRDSRGVFCIGMNYVDHALEAGTELGGSRRPAIFLKLASAMVGPEDELILQSRVSTEFDWEIELGVVIGKSARNLQTSEVSSCIAGYTIINDITARDLQREHAQWLIGKSIEASSPIGPWVTTADEVPFPPGLEMVLRVNGVEKQRARTDQMIYGIPEFISLISSSIGVEPGDVFATGTPSGVGFSRTPPEYLRSGDKVHAEIETLGVLSNVVG